MKLTKLSITNYRSITNCELPLRDLTTVIGPNGAGKTSLLEVFQLLQDASQQKLRDFLEARGGIQAVLSHTTNGTVPRLNVGLEVDVESEQSQAPMIYQFELTSSNLGYAIATERLEWHYDPRVPRPFRYIDARPNYVNYADPSGSGIVRPTWDYDILELGLAQIPKMYPQPEALCSLLAGTRHYSFLDVTPRAAIRLPQPLTPAVRPGPNGENLFSALYNLRVAHMETYERLEMLLKQGFPSFRRLEFPVVGAGQVTMAWHEQGSLQPFYPNQLSEGTLRFLWLVTILLSPQPPPLILLDEPEVSLHPELLKLLAALLQDTATSSRIVVATHASDLIRWLQPAEVLVADKEDNHTTLTWADTMDLQDWLAEYTLNELWLMGNLGGRP